MKKIFLLLALVGILFSCEKDDNTFDVMMPEKGLTFTPINGGAILTYELPKNKEVDAIKLTYLDFKGKEVVIESSNVNNTVKLLGFVDAKKDIPISVQLLDRAGNISKSIESKFSTLECIPSLVQKTVVVSPYWSGFSVKYESPDNPEGFIHIGRIGLNKLTNKIDTVPVESLLIKEGENVLSYTELQTKDNYTDVIVWTEDKIGNILKKSVFNKVVGIKDEMLDNKDFELISGSSNENDEKDLHWKNLFDGNKKGEGRLKTSGNQYSTFLSEEPGAPGDWIFDLKTERILSRIRIYGQLDQKRKSHHYDWPFDNMGYPGYLPCELDVYASQDNKTWDKLGSFYDSPRTAANKRWTSPILVDEVSHQTLESLKNADPMFLEVRFDYVEKNYRYLKLNIKNVYMYETQEGVVNKKKAVSFEELDVFSKVK